MTTYPLAKRIGRLIEDIMAGTIDTITFTSPPAVKGFEFAKKKQPDSCVKREAKPQSTCCVCRAVYFKNACDISCSIRCYANYLPHGTYGKGIGRFYFVILIVYFTLVAKLL